MPANICLVNPYMKYYTKINSKRVDLSTGIFKKINGELEKYGAFFEGKRADETGTFDEEILKLVLNRMLIKRGLIFYFTLFLSAQTPKTEK